MLKLIQMWLVLRTSFPNLFFSSTPSLTVPSSPGQRIVFASHNHYSTAKGFSQITGITRFNDNTYRVSSANPGTTFLADALPIQDRLRQ